MHATPEERWLPIPGYEGYEVSDHGQVRSWKSWRNTPVPRIRRQNIDPEGYRMVSFRLSGKGTVQRVHILVLSAFVGPRPDGLHTRHLDGNPSNNCLDNLAYGTVSENRHDSVRHGTHPETAKTHCPQVHAYDLANTRLRRGKRECRTCGREQARVRYHARKVRDSATQEGTD